MKRVLLIALAAAFTLVAGTAMAGTNDGAMVALHAKSHTTKATTICTTQKPVIPCSNYAKTWPVGSNSDVYIAVVRGSGSAGVAGVSCGIDYGPSIGVFAWTLCADLEFTNAGPNGLWPAAGGGTRMTWVTCQNAVIAPDGVHAVAGAFYVYAYGPDLFRVTPNNNLVSGAELAVADCAAATTQLPLTGYAGAVGFGVPGYNPCTDIVAAEPATWGAIKSKF